MTTYKAVAESNNFIVLDKYTKEWQVNESFQSEGDLERELIQDLSNQGYEYLSALTTPDAMLANVRKQLQALIRSNLPMPSGLAFASNTWTHQATIFLIKLAKCTVTIFSILSLMMAI